MTTMTVETRFPPRSGRSPSLPLPQSAFARQSSRLSVPSLSLRFDEFLLSHTEAYYAQAYHTLYSSIPLSSWTMEMQRVRSDSLIACNEFLSSIASWERKELVSDLIFIRVGGECFVTDLAMAARCSLARLVRSTSVCLYCAIPTIL